jgi:2-hydroxy-6-oxonona-2,4-dienedioate hydrolase
MFNQNYEKLEVKWVNVGGLNLHSIFVPHALSKNALPVVLVCGLGVSSEYMIPAALELAENAEIYCPNLPGFGKSSKPAGALNISELSDALSAFMDEMRIERAVLVGHSFGCQIAVELALHNREKIERLVLAAPIGDPRSKSALRYLARLALDAPREPFSLIPIAVKDYFSAGFRRISKTLRFSLDDRFEDKLPRIEVPTLVVRGSNDSVVSEEWTKRIAEILPQGKFASIEGAAHAVNYNSPEKFAGVIKEFLQGSGLNSYDKVQDRLKNAPF